MRRCGGGAARAGAVAVRAAVSELSPMARRHPVVQAPGQGPVLAGGLRAYLPKSTLAASGTSEDACQMSRLMANGAITGGALFKKRKCTA